MILWKFTFRELKNRPGRATLTLLSIVIGVAAVIAVTVGTATTHQASKDMYAAVAGRTGLEIVTAGDGFFEESVTADIEKIPGVKAAVPSVQKLSSLRFQGSRMGMLAMGIDPVRDAAVRDYELAEGEFFKEKYEAMLEVGFARGLGVHVGDEVKLGSTRGGLSGSMKTFKIVGLLSPRGAASFKQGSTIFMPLKTAEYLFSKVGNINTISVVLAEGADEKAMTETIRSRLPAGLTVRSPMERSQLSKEMIEKVRQGLNFSHVMILALAFFTILNTFLMNVGERRRQLAVLRAIGATRSQLMRVLLTEGIVMGVVGTVLGAAAGLGGAYLLAQSMSKIYNTPMPALQITPEPFILVAFLGPGISLLAMFVPAWIAGKVSPLEGMRFVAAQGRTRISLKYACFAVTVFLVMGSLIAACIAGYLPPQMMIVLGMLFTAAFLLLLPMILGLLAWAVSLVLYPILGTEGRIANRQVLRRRVRTTLTVGILYVAVSTAVSLGTNILDTVQDIHTWMEKTLKADFLVGAMKQDTATGMSAKMPESMVDELRTIDGVTDVSSLRFLSGAVRLNGPEGGKQQVVICVRDYTGTGTLPLDIKAGDTTKIRDNLAKGEVVLGTVLAHRIGVKVGDMVTLDTREGPKDIRVAATATAYYVGGMVIYMEGETARKLLNIEGVDKFSITTDPSKQEAVHAKLKEVCEANGLMVQSFADVRRNVDELTKGLIAGLWGLLVLGLVVGAFAVANTLTMNVLEQTRELALLRVVAMTRWQVRKTIFAQAIIVGMIGLLTGTVGGMIGAYVMNLSSVPLMGHAPTFALHPSLLAICFGIGMVVILLAAWLPAERASRLKLLIALQYE